MPNKILQKIMKQQNLTNWNKYRGIRGFFRYLKFYLLLGICISPIVLILLNPNIWQNIKDNDFSRSFTSFVFLVFIFSLLPSLVLGIVIWDAKNKQYNLLSTSEDKYKKIEDRTWYGKDGKWNNAIKYSTSLGFIVAFFTFGLLLGHNAPKYYAYPFFSGVLLIVFGIIYTISQSLINRIRSEKMIVPKFVKIVFVFLCALVLFSIFNLFMGIVEK